MYRLLFALSLVLFAAGSVAAEPVPLETETEGCPKVQAVSGGKPATTGEGTATTRPGTPAPVRPRAGTSRSTPRWNSLLPGMFR